MALDRYTEYPPTDRPLLEGGPFEAGYIAVHPFFEISGVDPALSDYGTVIVHRTQYAEDSIDEILEQIDVSGKGRIAADTVAVLAKARGRLLLWKEIGAATGLRTFSSLNRALLTTIGALRKQYEDRETASRIQDYCRMRQIFMPTEGQIQPTMERQIASLFRKAGVQELEVAGEFDKTGVAIDVSVLQGDQPWNITGLKHRPTRLYALDRSLLVAVDWDSFFTFVAGKRARLRRSEIESDFEGFACSSETLQDWWREDA